MNKRIIIIVALIMSFVIAQAKVRLPHLIGDGMVLQQNSEARLWGWDKPNTTVSVAVSWSSAKYTAMADGNGKWLVKVRTPAASNTPYSVTFNDGEVTVVNNVLIGEVWVCGGQSNMEMPVAGFPNCPVEGYNDAVTDAAKFSNIHFVKVPSVMSVRPLDDAQCQWESITTNSVADCSAVGYFFARLINRTLNIPVGLVLANKGGSRVESWLTADNLKKNTTEELDSVKMINKWSQDYMRPLLWGNGTFNPILNYTVKGILYYQGESNVGNLGNMYSERLKLLVDQWRGQFGLGEIPFYYVQIAPYICDDADGTVGALLREQQSRALDIIPNSDMVCTNDLIYPYETDQIHPAQKCQVGERLAYIALNKNYGMSKVMCESSRYKSMTISNDTCYVQLQNDYQGISRYNDLRGFEVAGADKVFHKAKATYYWTKGIIITSPEVKQPVAVRYCFRNFQVGNVKNMADLPLIPFRTDNW